MYFFEVALIGSSVPILTYSYKEKIDIARVVRVPLKNSIKEAIVLVSVEKPSFTTEDILEIKDLVYSKEHLEIANFIKNYYFSSLGEAIALFYPTNLDSNYLDSKEYSNLPILTNIQENAFKEIEKEKLSLLFGVTGSGKTEIYIKLIAKALNNGGAAIVLMPEIALTPQITKRVEDYFGSLVVSWHSKLTKKRREDILKRVYSGEIRVVIGARSALFLPLINLNIIIVDEEHDDSYKAFSRPRYNAKDLAIYMGKKLDIKVVLGSATPLVSSFKKYKVVRLKKPYKEASKEFRFISGEDIDFTILKEIENRIKKDEQALIFVPTRANFKYLVCTSCGQAHKCPYCSIGMSIHRKKRILQCHYCMYADKIATVCQICGSGSLASQRVGTSEVVELISKEIKDARVEQFDKDTITTANKLNKALLRVKEGESNIIVGTQMLSKGHDYPEITLSVITGLDYTAAMGDYRSKERTLSLMHQIAGRSGRSKDALILIQTSQPGFFNPYLKDYEDFLVEELEFREGMYPPYMALARVLISNRDYQKAYDITNKIEKQLRVYKEIEIVGAGTAPIERIANKWRFNILIRSKSKVFLVKILHSIFGIRDVEIDMDPVDFS